jgi:hypothetical protein
MYEKQLLKELESLRTDVANANQKVVPLKPNGLPKPSVILPLEDDTRLPIRSAATAPPIPRPSSGFPASTPSATQVSFRQHTPVQQSPGAGPSTARSSIAPLSPPDSAPPLGGRFGDGTQSMFVKRTASPFGPLVVGHSSSSASHPKGPLGGIIQTSTPTSPTPSHPLTGSDPLSSPLSAPLRPTSAQQQVFDPLGHLTPTNMSQSMRLQPSRPRLDARVAASKLANMF